MMKLSRKFFGVPVSRRAGVTLTELMVAMVIMSVAILSMVGAFKFLNVGVQSAKTRSLANNIAQERIEFLKNKSYYRVLVTTASTSDPNFSVGEMVYDVAPNGPETVNVGGITFIRRVYIRKVNEDSGGNLDYLAWDEPDPGLKEIKVYVVWKERGEWRKLEVRNLRENPARVNESAVIGGTVRDTGGAAIADVVVRAQENPSKYGETNASGVYSFTIEPGTYTLLATKDAYFPATLPSFGVLTAQTITGKDFTLAQMSSGTITGTVYISDHLLVSQVVGSSVNSSGFSQEWVEVYNPTTWTWTMATGLNAGVIGLAYQLRNQAKQIIPLDYSTLTLDPQHYYLFANTGTVMAANFDRTADAVYNTAAAGYPNIIKINTDAGNDAAGVAINWCATLTDIDAAGWKTGGQNPGLSMGTPINQETGLELDEQYIRKTSPGSMAVGIGRGYNTNSNNSDFMVMPLTYGPKNSATHENAATGTPAAGALVFTDDGLSAPVTADSAGAFNLTNVSTGSWIVYASSGLVFSSVAYYGGASANFVSAAGNLRISSATTYGYVTGRVVNVSGAALSGIKMFSTGSSQVATNSGGRYTLPVTAGMVNVVANYQSQSPSYVELSSAGVVVALGAIVKDVDFSLYYGGRIRGRVTTNGTDPLPNIPVVGFKAGVEQGSGISDSNGYFMISGSGISTGTYVVTPQLETGENSSPSSTTVLLQAGQTAFASTYTISGAFGSVSGGVRTGSPSGPVITTGVLVYITTSTLAANAAPPDITDALRGGTAVYYAASSNALGNYSIPVKGGYSYNVYAWYTTWRGATPTTARKESLAVTVNPAEAKTVDFFW